MATGSDVLVLDGDKIAALDIVRTLGGRGLAVTVGAPQANAIAFRSRFAKRRDVYPDPRSAPDAFVQWLEQLLTRGRFALVIPVTDLTAIPLARHAESLGRLAALATESFDKLQVVCDKLRTIELAQQVGVPVPRTAVLRSLADIATSERQYPLVCKPLRSSVWSERGYEATSVWYALTESDFRARAPKALSICPLLIQEYRKGHGVGIELLARDGELLQVFQHRRLHELPLTGGGSTYRISERIDPTLRDYAARLMAALRWTGVAMVEFKVDAATREAVLMEINGRFWGSLALSSRAGTPFAPALYELLVQGTVPAKRVYKEGFRCRKLRDDVEWAKEMLMLDSHDPLVTAGLIERARVSAVLADMARMVLPTERFDVQVLSDPRPGLRDVGETVWAQRQVLIRRLRRMTSRLQAARYRRAHLPRLVRCLQHAQRVLFVCHGNIMRSPFASAYYSRRNLEIPRRGPAMSAGLHASPGRTADPRAVDAGRAWGLDLSSHHSRLLDNDLLGWADVILVMDRTNLRAVQRLYPTAAHKTYLLGALDISCGADADLADPYSASPHATDTVCRRIAACIDRLLEHMQMAPPDAMHEAEAAGLSRPRDALRLPGSKTA